MSKGGTSRSKAIGNGVYATTGGRFYARRTARERGKNRHFHLGTFDTEAEARAAVAFANETRLGFVPSEYVALKQIESLDEFLRVALHYDPETGVLTKPYAQQPAHKKPSTHCNGGGYPVASVRWKGKSRMFLVHRLAWFLMTGSHPVGIVDHINGIRDDNRWTNLRHVSAIENSLNKAAATAQRNVVRFNGRYYPLIGSGYTCPHEAALVAEVL